MSPGTNISNFLTEMRSMLNADERGKFVDQGSENDRLFRDEYAHPHDMQDRSCDGLCDPEQSESRQDRGKEAVRGLDAPRIHYGNIGSSNQLQISAMKRNRCQEEHGVICFEMEGAGVIQTHPCLVIRGICDYSDSHKNKKWQPYAAATAAAYAKELLYEIPASRISGQSNSAVSDAKSSSQTNNFSGSIYTTGGKANFGNTFNSGGGPMSF
ncbi:MAG: hypothetical protein M1821_002526 [Bathelium mastoideum]|nr:MAG: hypothetical protein M1821_002526 [Bathelium mastoideum]